MANEDPAFGGMGSADAISAASAAISQMRSDMAAIDRHAKSVAGSMRRSATSARATSTAGAGKTGAGQPVSGGQGIGVADVTSALGGPMRTAVAGGALAAMIAGGIAPNQNMGTAALGVVGFSDLRVGADRALGYERNRLAYAFGSGGQFDQFKTQIERASTEFNVQNEQVFAQQYGALVGNYGLNAGDLGSRIMGDFGSLSVMAGIDQSQIMGAYNSMYGAPAYYAGLAMGVQTYDAQGNMMEPAAIVNQVWNTLTGGRGGNIPQEQLQKAMQPGSPVRRMIEQLTGGNPEAVAMVFRGLQLRQGQGGEELTSGALDEAALESGFYGSDQTQGMDSQLALEESRLVQTGEYTDTITETVATWTGAVEDTVDMYAEAEGALRNLIEAAEDLYTTFDVFGTEMPNATNAVISGFGGLVSLLGGLWFGSKLATAIGGAVGKALGRGGTPPSGQPGSRPGSGGGARPGGGSTGSSGSSGVRPTQSVKPPGRTGPSSPVGGLRGVKGFAAITAALEGWDIYQDIREEGFLRGLFSDQFELAENIEEYGFWEGLNRSADTPYNRQKYGDGEDTTPPDHLSGRSKGDWFVESDQISKIHYGEMVIPAQIAQAVRDELQMGKTSPIAGTRDRGTTNVNIYVQVQRATDHEAMMFANRVKRIIDDDTELTAIGAGQF